MSAKKEYKIILHYEKKPLFSCVKLKVVKKSKLNTPRSFP